MAKICLCAALGETDRKNHRWCPPSRAHTHAWLRRTESRRRNELKENRQTQRAGSRGSCAPSCLSYSWRGETTESCRCVPLSVFQGRLSLCGWKVRGIQRIVESWKPSEEGFSNRKWQMMWNAVESSRQLRTERYSLDLATGWSLVTFTKIYRGLESDEEEINEQIFFKETWLLRKKL